MAHNRIPLILLLGAALFLFLAAGGSPVLLPCPKECTKWCPGPADKPYCCGKWIEKCPAPDPNPPDPPPRAEEAASPIECGNSCSVRAQDCGGKPCSVSCPANKAAKCGYGQIEIPCPPAPFYPGQKCYEYRPSCICD